MKVHSAKLHDLKCTPEMFAALRSGLKTFEYRLNDRDYCADDQLKIREWDALRQEYTGHINYYEVTYVVYGPDFGIPENYVIMSVVPLGGSQ